MRNAIAGVSLAALSFGAGVLAGRPPEPRLAVHARIDTPCVCSAPGIRQRFALSHRGEDCAEKTVGQFARGYVPKTGKVVCP